MEIEIKVKLDTEKQRDLDMVEDILFQLQDLQELLEDRNKKLNKHINNNKQRK